jgi:hydroxyacylglutathione hydrolase
MTISIECLALGPLPTNAYIVACAGRKEAIVVDVPPEGAERILAYLKQKDLNLKAILISHGHWDHFADAQALKQKTQAKVYAHKGDKMLLENPILMKPFMPWGLSIKALEVDDWLSGNETLDLLGLSFGVRHVPGHAPGNVLFYLPSCSCAFVGDAIFKRSIGRTDLLGGNPEELLRSIRNQIFTLPADTLLYSGHGPVTSVREEQIHNPFFKA